jgi:selenocysteine-specific elongation factor
MAPPSSTESAPPEEVLNVNVGILGHVDSGKTSLVKTLSTLLSTAALDKSRESRQRGMTLDLGFSCFFLDMPPHLQKQYPKKTMLQMTLVDCPGHASLIRTIIGGAQIIDTALLLLDATKGWQAQTTECLVLAELTSPHLIVVLNKIDMFPEDNREELIEKAKQDVWNKLRKTRFANCTIIAVSACIGGEKVAAIEGNDIIPNQTTNVDILVDALQRELPTPKRGTSDTFYFSIDHCFAIRGQGTVLTGTVLSGHIEVNQLIEFPTLGLERKVKSMQMFRRKVKSIRQGDRAGICVSNFDPKLLERGIAASPGAVQLLKGAIAIVRKVSYFPGKLRCGSKFHISIGHATIMATVTFWGGKELAESQIDSKTSSICNEVVHSISHGKKSRTLLGHSSLGGDAQLAGLPRLSFDYNDDFIYQDEYLEQPEREGSSAELLHWALLDFQTPIYCPLESLIIGSRLDVETEGASSSCRLAFCGRIIEKADHAIDAKRIKIFTPKEKRGIVAKLGDSFRRECDEKIVCYEIYGDEMFKKETNMKAFVGMKVMTESGNIGEIKGSYGTAGQFRVWFPAGTSAKEGDVIILRFKRYAHDEKKEMHQDISLPEPRVGTRLEAPAKKKKVKLTYGEVVSLKGDEMPNGKFPIAIISGLFKPEINIRERCGALVSIPSTGEEGTIIGAFGKAGKCKVAFLNGVSASPGTKATMHS